MKDLDQLTTLFKTVALNQYMNLEPLYNFSGLGSLNNFNVS